MPPRELSGGFPELLHEGHSRQRLQALAARELLPRVVEGYNGRGAHGLWEVILQLPGPRAGKRAVRRLPASPLGFGIYHRFPAPRRPMSPRAKLLLSLPVIAAAVIVLVYFRLFASPVVIAVIFILYVVVSLRNRRKFRKQERGA